MAKKIFLLIFGFLASLTIKAQSAEEFLNSVISKTKSYNDISIVFNYKMVNENAGINESMSGYGSMKGDSYVINVNGQEMISDGTTLWTHLIDDEEVMISDVTEDGSVSPIAIIDSFSENIRVDFVNNVNDDITTLEVRENEGDTFEKIQISVDNDMKIKNVRVIVGDGNEFIYEITDFKTNQNLPDSMFIFDATLHPNVEVIDMR